ncbi:hypothetical protein [Nocardia sp. CC227C]|uniref:hypothetical protein n=1 Tax=Nocardia sp. CC227C TaxID=3044562 RepID=UPI00278C41B9|nr:hypothetical protein [Nocardia sp. CC227C]
MTRPDDEARDNGGPAPETERPAAAAGSSDPDADFMREFKESFVEASDEPDVGFTLLEPDTAPEADIAEQARELTHGLARELAAAGPHGWQQLNAVFAFTVAAEVVQVFFSDGESTVRVQPPPSALVLAREHRDLSARLSDGPWWRLLLSLNKSGQIEVDYDYGDEPFPDDQLFPAEAYRADLLEYPRTRLPVWLAAYTQHEGRQSRTPQEAAVQARADRESGIRATVSEGDFPAFPEMWARWAVISACFVAKRSQWGPRVLPALGWFEGSKRGGSTLYALPGGRAVLSGGVWDAPELDAAYNGGGPMPRFFAGAPEWVANPVLNPRAANGLLSFCYWWESGRWYRGESPAAAGLASALPGMWTADTVVDLVSGLIAEEPTERRRAAVATLVSAAEVGVVTLDTLIDAFGDDKQVDIDGAFYQLTMAGVVMTTPEPMSREEAVARVREHIRDSGMDTTGYPLEDLRADRISVGWMVYVPTQPGEIAIGRAIFYIADDGVLEHSSSSVAPSAYIAEFERRFAERHGAVDA